MKKTKKIGGFKTPLFKALEVSDRTATDYAFVIDGKIYATNATVLICQDLEKIHDMTEEEIKIIEGKSFHADLLEALWQFDQVIFTEKNIQASKGKSHVEFNYSHQVTPPDFEAVMKTARNKESVLNYTQIGLSSNFVKLITDLFDAPDSGLIVNLPESPNKGMIITSFEIDQEYQYALLMPRMINN